MNRNNADIFRTYETLDKCELTLSGWIKNLRASNAFGFIELGDGTCHKNIQVVIEKGELDNYEEITHYGIYSAIEVRGVLVLTPDNAQPFEIKASKVSLLAASEKDYPLQNKRHSFEYLREIAHLRPRANAFAATFRVRSLIAYAIHDFFRKRDFVYVNTPIITASDCEGAGEMFRISTLDFENPPRTQEDKIDYTKDFFGCETFLTVSGQLQAEALALAYKNVYTFGPTFRAENSNTTRHAAEFWMVEPEIAFADLQDDMDLAEAMMKHIITYVLENAANEIEFFNKFVDKGLLQRLMHVRDSAFERITYTQAINVLEKAGKTFAFPVSWGCDLQTEHERYLTEEYCKRPVFVTDYPKDIKAFYMRQNDDGKTVAAADLLVPGIGEIIGGSQREERLDRLEERSKELKMHTEPLYWYFDLRKYGGVKHAGYGLGFERAVMYLTGMKNIRDVEIFPRTVKNAKF